MVRLPREVVDFPALEASKARLDVAWSNLGWWKVGSGGQHMWLGHVQPKSLMFGFPKN